MRLPDWMTRFRPEGVRPCEVTSHQFHQNGWFHALYKTNESGPGERIFALVELRGGSVERYELSGCYSLKFLDATD